MTACSHNSDLEKWVQGADKKQKFVIKNKAMTINIALSFFSGYGVIIYYPEGSEMGRFGIGMDNFVEDNVRRVDDYTFEVSLDKSLNTQTGVYKFRIRVVWSDDTFEDHDYETYSDDREELFNSVEL